MQEGQHIVYRMLLHNCLQRLVFEICEYISYSNSVNSFTNVVSLLSVYSSYPRISFSLYHKYFEVLMLGRDLKETKNYLIECQI